MKLFFILITLSYLLLAAVLRFQFIHHYFFPVVIGILFMTVVSVMESRFTWILGLCIAAEIIFFPKYIYADSWRNYARFEKAVNYAIDNKLIQKGDNFNIIQITQLDLRSPNGFEYRFYFRKNGYKPTSEFEYINSDKLIIFSEIPNYDLHKLGTWEIDQFGTKYIKNAKKNKIGALEIYKLSR